jgi:hypothetical protein
MVGHPRAYRIFDGALGTNIVTHAKVNANFDPEIGLSQVTLHMLIATMLVTAKRRAFFSVAFARSLMCNTSRWCATRRLSANGSLNALPSCLHSATSWPRQIILEGPKTTLPPARNQSDRRQV